MRSSADSRMKAGSAATVIVNSEASDAPGELEVRARSYGSFSVARMIWAAKGFRPARRRKTSH